MGRRKSFGGKGEEGRFLYNKTIYHSTRFLYMRTPSVGTRRRWFASRCSFDFTWRSHHCIGREVDADRCGAYIQKNVMTINSGCYDNKLWFLVHSAAAAAVATFSLFASCGVALSSLVKHEVGLSELNVTRVLVLLVFFSLLSISQLSGFHISIMHWRLRPNWYGSNSLSHNLLNIVIIIGGMAAMTRKTQNVCPHGNDLWHGRRQLNVAQARKSLAVGSIISEHTLNKKCD